MALGGLLDFLADLWGLFAVSETSAEANADASGRAHLVAAVGAVSQRLALSPSAPAPAMGALAASASLVAAPSEDASLLAALGTVADTFARSPSGAQLASRKPPAAGPPAAPLALGVPPVAAADASAPLPGALGGAALPLLAAFLDAAATKGSGTCEGGGELSLAGTAWDTKPRTATAGGKVRRCAPRGVSAGFWRLGVHRGLRRSCPLLRALLPENDFSPSSPRPILAAPGVPRDDSQGQGLGVGPRLRPLVPRRLRRPPFSVWAPGRPPRQDGHGSRRHGACAR